MHNESLVPVFVINQFEEVFTLGSMNLEAVARLREDLADLVENRVPGGDRTAPGAGRTGLYALALAGCRYRVLLSFRENSATAFERWKELPSLMPQPFQLLPDDRGPRRSRRYTDPRRT